MERLTEKHYGASDYYMVCSENCANDAEMCGGCPWLEKIINRLGAYEDTGLEPESILQLKKIPEFFNCSASDPAQLKQLFDKLQSWADAAREGRLVVLPCRVGDTLFDTTLGDLAELTVRSIPIMIYPDHQYIGVNATNYRGAYLLVEMWQIGKTVFLTHKEAEAALKGGNHETNL